MTNYLKALTGSLIAGLGSLYQALDNGSVTAQEWVAVAIATLAALGVVWGVPNLPVRAKDQRGALSAGDVLVVALVAFAVLVLVLWLR